MIVLGCDPGLAACGLALVSVERGKPSRVVEAITVRTVPADSLQDRIALLIDAASLLIYGGAFPANIPELVVIESQLRAVRGHTERGTTNHTALAPTVVMGALIGWALDERLQVELVEPQQAKAAVGCGGRGTKRTVKAAVHAIEGGTCAKSDHSADAVAIAIAGGKRHDSGAALAQAIRKAKP
ncbi:MAG: crossover junction endodeoxyribonuclease RuvC [Giesbergeria sp.]